MALEENIDILVRLLLNNEQFKKATGQAEKAESKRQKAAVKGIKEEAKAREHLEASIKKVGLQLFTLEKGIQFVKQSVTAFLESNRASDDAKKTAEALGQAWKDLQVTVGQFLFEAGKPLVEFLTGLISTTGAVVTTLNEVVTDILGIERRVVFELKGVAVAELQKQERAAKTTIEQLKFDIESLQAIPEDQQFGGRGAIEGLKTRLALKQAEVAAIQDEIKARKEALAISKLETNFRTLGLKLSGIKERKISTGAKKREKVDLGEGIFDISEDTQARLKAIFNASLSNAQEYIRQRQASQEKADAWLVAKKAATNKLLKGLHAQGAKELKEIDDRAFEARKAQYLAISMAATDSIAAVVSGEMSAAKAAKMAIAQVLDALAVKLLVKAAEAFAGQNYAAAAGYTAAAGLAKAGAAKIAASSGGGGGATASSFGGGFGGAESVAPAQQRNVTIILGSSWGDEPVRVRRQRLARAIKEANTIPEADVYENR